MRYFKRLLLFWAAMLPLFYFAILPYLMDRLDQRARMQNYNACIAKLAAAQVPQAKAESYCHCVTGGLTFAKQDLIDMVLRKPPAQLTEQMKSATETCNVILEVGS